MSLLWLLRSPSHTCLCLLFILLNIYYLLGVVQAQPNPSDKGDGQLLLSVQATLSDLSILRSASESIGIHVVITAQKRELSHLNSDSVKPLVHESIRIKAIPSPVQASRNSQQEQKIHVLHESGDGTGGVNEYWLDPYSDPLIFKTNGFGRVSFTIGLETANTHILSQIPILFLQTQDMINMSGKKNENSLTVPWYSAFLDIACLWQIAHHRLPMHDMESQHSGPSVVRGLRSVQHLARHALNQVSKMTIDPFKSEGRVRLVRAIQDQYEPSSNMVPLYLIEISRFGDSMPTRPLTSNTDDLIMASLAFQRPLPPKPMNARRVRLVRRSLHTNESDVDPALFTRDHNLASESTKPATSDSFHVIAGDKHRSWALALHDDGQFVLACIRDASQELRRIVLNTFMTIWKGIEYILHQIGIALSTIFRAVRTFFDWHDIMNTQKFLTIYFRLLAPRAFTGLDLIREDYHQFMKNSSIKTQELFQSSIRHFSDESYGMSDLTLNEVSKTLRRSQNLTDNNGSLSSSVSIVFSNFTSSNYVPDARTLYMQDRLIGNVQYSELIIAQNGSNPISRMYSLLKEAARTLVGFMDAEQLRQFLPHIIKFSGHATHMHQMTLVHILNLLQSFVLLAGDIFGHALDAVFALMPAYWQMVNMLMLYQVRIPFVDELWVRYSNNSASKKHQIEADIRFSILDVWTFFGSIFATGMFKFYFNNEAPFSDMDIEVLSSCTEAELLVHTWNTDPRTSAAHNEPLREHRLGVYDWIPRAHVTVIHAGFEVLYNVALLTMEGNARDPTSELMGPQIYRAIGSFMEQIYDYPFTQLNSSDTVTVLESKNNPDPRFLWYWFTSITETFVATVQPFMGKMWNSYPLFGIVNFATEGLPILTFGFRIQYDTLQGVASDDYARLAVVYLEWASQVTKVIGVLVPFMPIEDSEISMASVVVDLVEHALFDFPKLNIMFQQRIVGLLSSSYQGNATSELASWD